ncbi:hypothetical protein M404DRAFT_34529 [Pisolithus tinctorius Marx 270]|uniref:Uncharacterized protein n=1 Tax=Pisolithus tinctorius Marx 270 TaxID=870435 RepID=A0A0C3ID93_PISTI|nr:hypothetical protein M404DRAFT_34529 [Pisolithus tinctorius Marx 270]
MTQTSVPSTVVKVTISHNIKAMCMSFEQREPGPITLEIFNEDVIQPTPPRPTLERVPSSDPDETESEEEPQMMVLMNSQANLLAETLESQAHLCNQQPKYTPSHAENVGITIEGHPDCLRTPDLPSALQQEITDWDYNMSIDQDIDGPNFHHADTWLGADDGFPRCDQAPAATAALLNVYEAPQPQVDPEMQQIHSEMECLLEEIHLEQSH